MRGTQNIVAINLVRRALTDPNQDAGMLLQNGKEVLSAALGKLLGISQPQQVAFSLFLQNAALCRDGTRDDRTGQWATTGLVDTDQKRTACLPVLAVAELQYPESVVPAA